jgi:hypothetical protein
MTKKQYRMPNVNVGTAKKSIAAMASRWFRRNVSQRFATSGGLGALRLKIATLPKTSLVFTLALAKCDQPLCWDRASFLLRALFALAVPARALPKKGTHNTAYKHKLYHQLRWWFR